MADYRHAVSCGELYMAIKDVEKKVDNILKKGRPDSAIAPVRLEKDSTFCFSCHPGVPCFTDCCRNMNIILTPYDIVRLKKRLGLDSDAFLHLYATPELLGITMLPVARLKMLEDQGGKCPFVTPDGCQVYSDRPVCCRYYPIGLASLRQQEKTSGEEEEFFFMVQEDHCKGFEETAEWTVESWRGDQEADLYDRMNREWMELLLRKKSFGEHTELPEKARKLFYMVSTNMEWFKSYVFESRFLETYVVSDDILGKILADDVELMQFGFEYLKHAVFGADSRVISIRQDILDKTVKKIRKRRRKQRLKMERMKKGRR